MFSSRHSWMLQKPINALISSSKLSSKNETDHIWIETAIKMADKKPIKSPKRIATHILGKRKKINSMNQVKRLVRDK